MPKQKKKRMRLPNGFGQISELKGRRLRKPFRAMITVDKTDDGKPICRPLKPVAYFATYNEAYAALIEYNKDPYERSTSMTLEELYVEWSEKYFKTLSSDSSIRTIKSAWKHCEELRKYNVSAIRPRHIKGCIESQSSPNIKARIKSLMNIMLDYALEYEIVAKNYARDFNLDENIKIEKEKSRREHLSFTDEEMSILWNNSENIIVKMILIQCYTGFRPKELIELKTRNVKLDENIIIGGMKTKAGTDRVVPIHKKIKEHVKNFVNQDSEYLFPDMTYDKYNYRFERIVDKLNLDKRHRPHDPRKHFITMAKKYNVNEYAIKRIVGHSITDITEKIYTERNLEWMQEEINKIEADQLTSQPQ